MEMALWAAAGVMLLAGAAVMLYGFLRGRGEYDELLEPLDEKEFRLKSFLPAGLYLADNVQLSRCLPKDLREYQRRYATRVNAQLAEIYGLREWDFYAQIHTANKWILALLVYVFLTIFALISCSNGDYSSVAMFLALAPAALIGVPFLLDKELTNKIEKRREQILLEFPEFVNKLILLVNAGSTISKAWEKIVSENQSDSPLFKELRVCAAEIAAGKPEAVAYEEFARRCKIKEIIKFVSVIILNLRKGGSEVVPILRAQADECWEARKATARRLGEKASSKLLLPMSIMLLGIIMIVALPAILALSGM